MHMQIQSDAYVNEPHTTRLPPFTTFPRVHPQNLRASVCIKAYSAMLDAGRYQAFCRWVCSVFQVVSCHPAQEVFQLHFILQLNGCWRLYLTPLTNPWKE
jgi:hypothetical protein